MKKYNQHYVPKSILKNFIDDNTVFCLMKDKGIIIPSNIKNLCAEKDFYVFSLDIEDEDTGKMFDYDKQIFEKIDNQIAPIVTKLVKNGNIDVLTDDDRKNLAKFITYQYIRSPAVKNISQSLCLDEKKSRQFQGLNLLDEKFIKKVSEIIYNFKLKLIKANKDVKYIISDSPVLWSPTGEGIYFPISPDYCLCYQKRNHTTLDSISINELEFLASVRFNISQDEDILDQIWKQKYQSYINEFCNTSNDSYWKCILRKKNSLYCIEKFKSFLQSESISQFNEWKSHLVTDPNIMGGQTVFPNSRLSVNHIGKIINRGESIQVIKEDYPYLSQLDLKFASLYVKAYPIMGRQKKRMKFLIYEDISPSVARILCEQLLVDAVAVRDRGLLGVSDQKILEYAFSEDRIVVTANIKDFEAFANATEVHAGIVFIQEGDLLRDQQIEICFAAVEFIQQEITSGRDMINQVLYISINGSKKLENLP